MWATLALAAVLQPVPAQGAKLKIDNVRNTYGILGPERKGGELLPGDMFVVSFDLVGLQAKEDGRVEYTMGMELKDSKGKSLFKQEPADLHAMNVLGGSQLPAFARIDVGLDTPPGEYTLTVNVTDRIGKSSEKLERKFTVKKKELGMVSLVLTNEVGSPVPPVLFPGQTLMVSYLLVGFELKGDKPQPDLSFEMKILDEAGKPTVAKPSIDAVKKIDDEQSGKRYPISYQIPINRTGKFTIVLKATDKHTGKSVEEKVAIRVAEPK